MGGKNRLIRNGLLNYFPGEINKFVDLFGGGFNVGINIGAKSYVYNDILPHLTKFMRWWYEETGENIVKYVEDRIAEYKVDTQDGYKNLIVEYNKNRDARDLFVLSCYAFNNFIQFNNNNEFNTAYAAVGKYVEKGGHRYNSNIRNNLMVFSDRLKQYDLEITNKTFRELDIDSLSVGDYVYIDPPYILTCVNYQGEGDIPKWSEKDEIDLYNFCRELDKRGIHFGVSNVVKSKGKTNEHLDKFMQDYIVHYPNIKYNNCTGTRKGHSEGEDVEVFVTNYDCYACDTSGF